MGVGRGGKHVVAVDDDDGVCVTRPLQILVHRTEAPDAQGKVDHTKEEIKKRRT
jgi:hypothetical protein